MKDFKPLLASPVEFDKLDYTNLWGSMKLDGIRCIVKDGVLISRKLKPIPNLYVQKRFGGRRDLEGYDGELIVGPPNAHDVYHRTYSGVMSVEGEPEVKFYAFDHVGQPEAEYQSRYSQLVRYDDSIMVVQQFPITSERVLLAMEQDLLDTGYEGMMLRAFFGPKSRYKFGRSTAKEGTLLKLKRFVDSEATIIGFIEQMQNTNEARTNALGQTERSSHAEGKVGKATLGALVVTMDGLTFNIGTGFDDKTRADIWWNQDKYRGQLVKFKHFQIGVKDLPRFPVFLGFRSPLDMS